MLAELALTGIITGWASNVASDWTGNLLGVTSRRMQRAFGSSERLEALEPDELTPRQALELLYELKGLTAG